MYRFFSSLLEPLLLLYLLTALAVVHLWRKRRETRGRLLLLSVPFGLLIVMSTRATAFLALGSLEWHYPPQDQRPDDAEAIVVLSGLLRRPDGVRRQAELGEDTLYRCLHASRLYRQGEPCPVVATGGKVDPAAPGPTLAAAMREFLRTQGVAESDLLVEDRSRTTYENALETAKLLRRRGIEKIVLVTDATHMLRAVRCFQAQGFEVIPSGCYYRATCFNWSLSNFLPNPGAARDMQRALHEWVGILWYWLRGRI